MSEMQRATLARRWVIKTLVVMVALAGLGVWGLWDATVVYPRKGERHAEWAKWQYLQQARDAGRLSQAGVSDPEGELARLRENERQIRTATGEGAGPRRAEAEMELARLEWLTALGRLGRLDPDRTAISDPRRALDELTTTWGGSDAPSPLSAYDIPLQWLITFGGFLGAGLVLVFFLRVKGQRFAFEPETMRLHLADGSTLVPEDVEVFDKRKWHRFIVFLKIRDGHEKHGGQELKLDLYRHNELEGWVKQMFARAHPEEYDKAFPDEGDEGEGAADGAEDQGGEGISGNGGDQDTPAEREQERV